jgi:hypothetical protein
MPPCKELVVSRYHEEATFCFNIIAWHLQRLTPAACITHYLLLTNIKLGGSTKFSVIHPTTRTKARLMLTAVSSKTKGGKQPTPPISPITSGTKIPFLESQKMMMM